jgi:hypothetical protein
MGFGRKLRRHKARGEPPRANQFSAVPILMMLDPKDALLLRFRQRL